MISYFKPEKEDHEKPSWLKWDKNKKKKKYGNNSCTCSQGHIHDSRLEARHCYSLHLMKKARGSTISTIERQVTFRLDVNGKHICSHRVDFLVTHKDGSKMVVESKGVDTAAWAIKRNLFEALNPNIKYETWR
jgi:DNA-binding sugar fermentation-stimulating protein